jgi:hypothetical protein
LILTPAIPLSGAAFAEIVVIGAPFTLTLATPSLTSIFTP